MWLIRWLLVAKLRLKEPKKDVKNYYLGFIKTNNMNAISNIDKVVINYISKNLSDRITCINALMKFRAAECNQIDLIKAFDTWADMKLPMLQMTLSTIYLFIEQGKIQEATKFYLEQIKEHDLFSKQSRTFTG